MELQTGKFSLINAGWTEANFKKEWSHIEREGVKALLTELIREEYEVKRQDSNHFFGFCWTSHGRFAELGVNGRFSIDGNDLRAFIISNNNILVAHCFDEDENDVFYEVQ